MYYDNINFYVSTLYLYVLPFFFVTVFTSLFFFFCGAPLNNNWSWARFVGEYLSMDV